jgi:GAF domain-containing protein
MIHNPQDNALRQVITGILEEIAEISKCQSIGIRLEKDGDYPYYAHAGFPDFFILKENSLCANDEKGKPILDTDGNPLLECMCGNVLKGRVDPNLPYFTARGSFWTNSTTHLLKSTTEKDLQSRTRNMCHYSGYESVALIPVRSGQLIVGLIQINDPRVNMFTPEDIKNYESIANQMGVVVSNALEIQQKVNIIFDLLSKYKIN